MTDEEDLLNNDIHPDTVARELYNRFKGLGMTHKEAVAAVLDGVESITSESIDERALHIIRGAIFKFKGQWF